MYSWCSLDADEVEEDELDSELLLELDEELDEFTDEALDSFSLFSSCSSSS